MIPVYLKMEGFLTFKRPTEIRFSDFADDGLFLVSGPTGSGKTTIFDAITYALYGVATSSQRSPAELRSQLIDAEADFGVEFQFTTGGHDYQIQRWQKGMRPGKVRLTVDGDESSALTKVREINDKLFEVLGLTADQFCKIVMLPQGEFRNFLAASSKDKSDILRKLFATEHYAEIREAIRTRVIRIRGAVDDAMLLINAEKKVSAAANAAVDPAEIEAILRREAATATLEAAAHRAELALLQTRLKDHQQAWEEARRINQELAALAALEAALAQDQLKTADHRANLRLADQLNRIRPVKVQRDSLLRSELTLADRSSVRTKLASELALAGERLEAARSVEADNPRRQTRLMALARELDELARSLQALQTLHQVMSQHETAQTQVTELARQQNRHLDLKTRLETHLTATEALQIRERQTADEVTALREGWQELRPLVKAAATWQSLSLEGQALATERAETELNLPQLKDRLTMRDAEVTELRRDLDRQGLGHYAASLVPGEACPLCGSLDHPVPYTADPDLDEAVVRQAELARREAEQTLLAAESRIRFLQESLAARAAQLAELTGDYDETRLSQDLARLQSQLDDLERLGREKKADHDQLARELKDALATRQSIESELRACPDVAATWNQAREELAGLTVRLTDLRAQSGNLDEAALLQEKTQRETEQRSLEQAIRQATEELTRTQARVTELTARIGALSDEIAALEAVITKDRAAFDQALQEQDLSLEEYLALEARLSEEMTLRQAAEAFFRKFEADTTRCEVLRDQLKDRTPQDLDTMAAAIDQLTGEIDILAGTCDDCIRREAKLGEACSKVTAARIDHDRASQLYDIARRLDQTTGKGTTFENYVLGYYLDGVLANANQRLKNMTANRFRLQRQNQDSGGKNRIEGLDLLVFDSYSNSSRDVRTLSGGEGFKASLALALGLSDFIQEKNAGIRLDTIFIDEGFGTLDQESLDAAMETILELQGLGRLVGIISHVEELKERIPTQIIVENRREEGSVLKVVKH